MKTRSELIKELSIILGVKLKASTKYLELCALKNEVYKAEGFSEKFKMVQDIMDKIES